MKRMYFLLNNAQPAQAISHDLVSTGINEGQLHFMNKSPIKLESQGVNQTNLFEEKDIGHYGIYGGMLGFCAGVLFTLAVSATSFGSYINPYAVVFLIGLFTAFGFWSGGIAGISKENHHIEKFRKDIRKGKTLLMVDAYDDQEEKQLKEVMFSRHREARYEGEDPEHREFL